MKYMKHLLLVLVAPLDQFQLSSQFSKMTYVIVTNRNPPLSASVWSCCCVQWWSSLSAQCGAGRWGTPPAVHAPAAAGPLSPSAPPDTAPALQEVQPTAQEKTAVLLVLISVFTQNLFSCGDSTQLQQKKQTKPRNGPEWSINTQKSYRNPLLTLL